MEYNAEAHRLSENTDLSTNVSIADDAEGLVAHLVRSLRDLVPIAFVNLARAITELTRKHDDLGDHELGNASCIGERRIENGNTASIGIHQVDLVRSDTEAADGNELGRVREHFVGDARLRANAEEIDIAAEL